MRFSYHPSMCDPSFYLELGKAAEAAGFDAITFPDSICYPKECDSTYPYNDDGSREFLDGVPFLEPFSIIPAIAAVTEKLEFSTYIEDCNVFARYLLKCCSSSSSRMKSFATISQLPKRDGGVLNIPPRDLYIFVISAFPSGESWA